MVAKKILELKNDEENSTFCGNFGLNFMRLANPWSCWTNELDGDA